LQQELDLLSQSTNQVVDLYFPLPLPKPILKQWYLTAASNFFSAYDEGLAQLILKGEPIRISAHQLLAESLNETSRSLRLEENARQLEDCFRAWLNDHKNPLVHGQIWSFAQAMLAAKIVSASVGADPIAAITFRNGKFFLDTNILFLIATESDAPVFENIVSSLRHFGATIHVLPSTLEEYENAVNHKEALVLKAIDEVGTDVLTRSDDNVLKAAQARGCTLRDHYQTFFDHMRDVPHSDEFRKVVVVESHPEVLGEAKKGAQDSILGENIAQAWRDMYSSEKNSRVVAHDAALAQVCTNLRNKGGNVWVITQDKSMHFLASRWAGKTSVPTWISVDTLVQLIAYADVSPDHDPQNFAPLFAALIKAEVHVRTDTFRIEDLANLIDNEERLRQLSTDDVARYATAVARARFSGQPIEAVITDIRRALQREIREVDEVTRELRTQLSDTAELGEAARKVAVEMLYYKYRRRNRFVAITLAVFGVVSAIGSFLLSTHLATSHPLLSSFLNLVCLGLLFGPMWPAKEKWSTSGTRALRKAAEEAERMISAKNQDTVGV
jgi:hypothetical protein